MRLLVIGSLGGKIADAGKIAFARGASVVHREDISGALDSLRNGQGADLVMIDARLDVAKLVASLANERIHVPVVACGLGIKAAEARQAIEAGAKEYIPLPPDAELIASVLEAATQESSDVIYLDPTMAKVINMAEQIANSDASVLITGESGTGKEVISKFIHAKSKRAKKKFISVNCAAIPENLLESELFGHERGAFTGAVARRIGKFEEASGGTLLLDEISEMQPHLQAKLLRVLQERVIERIGDNAPIKVDIRLLSTANRDLRQAVKEGKFREDLLYRLNVVNIHMPALRDRMGDIKALAPFFIQKYCLSNGLPPKQLSPEAEKRLLSYRWPGNVRELENTMHRAVLMSNGSIIQDNAIMLTDEQPLNRSSSANSAEPAGTMAGRSMADMERQLILDTLDHCLGNRTHAAKILGISIRTLRNKLNQYGIQGQDSSAPSSLSSHG